jgi:hypothetical protein
MKIRISGVEYNAALLGQLTLFDILELKRQTGLSVDELQSAFADVDPDNPEAAMRSEDTLVGFGAVIWLARRKAGERLTFEQACDFPLDQLEFVAEPGDGLDDAEPVDPPSPRPDSGLGVNPATPAVDA